MPSATKKSKFKRKEQVTSEPRMICSMEVGGGAYRPGSISWSTTGQAVVVLDAVIHIFTPSLGFHSNLKPNARMNSHQLPTSDPFDLPASSGTQLHSDDSIDPFDHYHWALDIGHEITEGNHRDIVANDSLLGLPTLAAARWRDACWSPSGFGSNESCLLATLNSELEISIYSAPLNPFLGPWTRERQVQLESANSDSARVKFLSTQVTAISWSTATTLNASSSDGDRLSFLAAGTRIGEFLIWKFQTGDSNPEQVLRIKLDCDYVSKVVFSSWINLGDDTSRSRLALFAEQKLVVVKISISDEGDFEYEVEHQISLIDQQISSALWVSDRLIFSAPGELHCFDATSPSRRVRTLDLEAGTQIRANPLASAITISPLTSDSVEVTLQEGSTYQVNLSDFDSEPEKRRPVQNPTIEASSTLRIGTGTGAVRGLQHELESHQVTQAFEPDLSSSSHDSSSGIYAVSQSAEETAAWRYRLNWSSTFGLMIRDPISIETSAISLLSQAFEALDSDPDLTPIHSMRALIALYAASEPSRSQQILSVIIQELEKKVEEMEVGPPSAGVDMGSKARERQLVTWLAQWIEAQPNKPSSSSDPSQKLSERASKAQLSYILQARLNFALDYLEKDQHSMDVDGATDDDNSDSSYPLRLCASSFLSSTSEDKSLRKSIFNLLSKSKGENTSKSLQREWLKLSDEDEDAFLNVEEACPACNAEISLRREDSTSVAICSNHHVWERCSITLKILDDPDNIRTCVGCWSKSVRPVEGNASRSLAQETLKKAKRCQSCGNAWVSIV